MGALPGRLALLAAIGTGGAVGTAARYGTALAVDQDPDEFPVATFLVNVVGAVILGAVAELPKGSLPAHELTRPAIGTGFCGGLTTFSTMSLEIDHLWPHQPEVAATYAVTSLAAAMTCAWTGVALVHAARAVRRKWRPGPGPEQDKM
jgi:CrcB protein